MAEAELSEEWRSSFLSSDALTVPARPAASSSPHVTFDPSGSGQLRDESGNYVDVAYPVGFVTDWLQPREATPLFSSEVQAPEIVDQR